MNQKNKCTIVFIYLENLLLCYNTLFTLTKKQKDIFTENKSKQIDLVLKEKDDCILKIKKLDLHLKKEKEKLPPQLWQKDLKIKQLLDSLEDIIKKVIAAEDECRTIMIDKKEGLKNKYHTINHGKKVISRYYTGKKGQSFFVDYKE